MNLKYRKNRVFAWLTYSCFSLILLISWLLWLPAAPQKSQIKEHTSANETNSNEQDRTPPHILSHPNVRARTNPVTGFSNLRSPSGEYNYSLCDVLVSGYWKTGVVISDQNHNFLASWACPAEFNSRDLSNSFTSHIAIGNSDTEVFVLLGVSDMIRAVNDAYLKEQLQPIYIVRLNFDSTHKTLNLTQLMPFHYPGSINNAWFSKRGHYRENAKQLHKNTYSIGRYGYIHFLTYGHLFAYNNVGSKTSAIDEFLLVPALIKRSPSLGGLYSPVIVSQKKAENSSFGQRKTWKSIIDNNGKLVFENPRRAYVYPDTERTFALYAVRQMENMIKADEWYSKDRENETGSDLLMQPGWCVFRPFSALTRFVSPSLEEEIGVVQTDAVGLFTQLDTVFKQSKRVIRAVRVVGRHNQTLFVGPTNLVHFNAEWGWFAGKERLVNKAAVYFELPPTQNIDSGVNLDFYGWRLTNYEEIIANPEFHVSALPLNGDYLSRTRRSVDLLKSNFVVRSSGALGTSIPFLIFAFENELKIHTGKLTGNRETDLRDAVPLKIFAGLSEVTAILGFEIGNLSGEGILVIAENGLLTYRFHDAKLGFAEVRERQFCRSDIDTYALGLIFFHARSKLVEENLVKVTLGFHEPLSNSWRSRLFALEWTKDRLMLTPLECTEKTRIDLKAKIPKRYETLTSLQIATMDPKELQRDFTLDTSAGECQQEWCQQAYLAVHHVPDGNKPNEKNRVALSLRLKIGDQLYTGFLRQNSNKGRWDTFVVYRGISGGQKYFAVFKPRNEVKEMPISQYTVGQIYEMYNSEQRTNIEKELLNLVQIEPSEIKDDWKFLVRIVDANATNNTLSLEALLVVGEYQEPLKIKGSERSVMVYNDVFYKPDHTWVYLLVALGIGLVIIVSLGVGIGLPMRRQHKINLMNARLANRRFERIAEAVMFSAQKMMEHKPAVNEQPYPYLLEEAQRPVNEPVASRPYYLPAPKNYPPNQPPYPPAKFRKNKKFPPKNDSQQR